MDNEQLGTVGIVGAGLIGASIGMALTAAGIDVLIRDRDPEQANVAVARKAGRLWPDGEQVGHAVIAVPPHAVAEVLLELQHTGAALTASDVASVKSQVIAEARALGCDLSAFCPAHPVAGRERGGAVSAQVDLFRDCTWVLCPTGDTSEAARGSAGAVGDICGGWLVLQDAERHDRLMAKLSHVPQVVASALAAEATQGMLDHDLDLAGMGLRDTTRIADSDAGLWASILEGNREPVADSLDRLARSLDALSMTLRAGSAAEVFTAVEDLLVAGRLSRRRLPTKVGQPVPNWSWVGVVVPDQAGELARLFKAIGEWNINVEDVRVEHSHEQPQGVAELAVAPDAAQRLTDLLQAAGWRAYRRE